MTILIEVTCRGCGLAWTPSPQDIRQGIWKRCPPCRDGPDSTGIRSHVTTNQCLRIDPTTSNTAKHKEVTP